MSAQHTRPSRAESTKTLSASELPDVEATEIIDAGELSREDPIAQLRPGQKIRSRHRYELRHPLGAGASGTVWAAACIEADYDAADIPPEVTAIKFFNVSSADEGAGPLRRELAALRSMRSRSIPRIYDWAIDDELSFFVMDYYRHGSLADTFKSSGRLDDKTTWHLLGDLLRALTVAHRAGVLHLDIKPSNIMRDGVGGYHLIDFGISQATQVIEGPGRTIGAGSQGYQAPEQRRLELHKFDTRTDLWAVGATAWAVRTGCDLACQPEKLDQNAVGDAPSLPAVSREGVVVAPALEELIMELVRENQAARPGGAAAALGRVKEATRMAVPDESRGAISRPCSPEEVDAIIEQLMDPLWSSLCRRDDFRRYFAKFEDGDYLCREGRGSYDAFVLLSGKVRIEQGGENLSIDEREGMFIGEISTLTGTQRAASVRAEGTVWTCRFNAAEFERLLAAHPSIGIRLLKLMAERITHTSRDK